MCRLWFTSADFAKASRLDKVIHSLVIVSQMAFYPCAILYQLLHAKESKMEVLLHKLGFLCTLPMVSVQYVSAYRHRKEYSDLIDFVNCLCKEILNRPDLDELRALRNAIYVFIMTLLIATVPLCLFVLIPIILEAVINGQLYFKTIISADHQPHSLGLYLECGAHLLILALMFCKGCLLMPMSFEPYLRLAEAYKIIAKDLNSLRQKGVAFSEQQELHKLRSSMAKCSVINR